MSYSKLKLSLQSGNSVVSYQCQLTERISVLGALATIASTSFHLPCYLWNLGSNTLALIGSDKQEVLADFNSSTNPFSVLQFLLTEAQSGIFILENLHPFLVASSPDVASQVAVVRLVSQVTSLAFDFKDSQKFIILLSTADRELPPALSSVVPEFIHPLPSYEDNVALLKDFLPSLDPALDTGIIPQLAVSAGGLSTEEIKSGLRYSFHLNGGKLTPDVTQNLLDYKIDRLKAFNLAFTAPPNV
ncbi:MAG TPA: hypothetical protein V6C85_14320, partial [Allocoleopsis sp.]